MTEIDYANARPLDVHRWSEYPEVNDFVGHVFTDLPSIDGNSRISKKLVKVILLDHYAGPPSQRHLSELELFREFKGKPLWEDWVPDWTAVY